MKQFYLDEMANLAQKWQSSYTVYTRVNNEKNCLYLGFSDREKNIPLKADDKFCFGLLHSSFPKLSIMKLVEQGKLSCEDTLDKFVPQYIHASKIKIIDMLKDVSGIPDYIYGKLYTQEQERMLTLDKEAREIEGILLGEERQGFDSVMQLIGQDDLLFEPNTSMPYSSASNDVFLAEVVKKVSGKDLFDFVKEHFFDVVGAGDIVRGNEKTVENYLCIDDTYFIKTPNCINEMCFTATAEQMYKVATAFAEGKFFEKKTFAKMEKFNAFGDGLGISLDNGCICVSMGLYANCQAWVYFKKTGDFIMCLQNSCNRFDLDNGVVTSFMMEALSVFCGAVTTLQNPKMMSVNEKNIWDVVAMKVLPSQRKFISPPAVDLAFAYAKKLKIFALYEGLQVVGLLILEVNKKQKRFYIDGVMIDKYYQGKGFGKFMVKFAVDYLKKAGATELSIHCRIENKVARRLYESVGFSIAEIYTKAVYMKMKL